MGRRMDSAGNLVNFNVTPENQLAGADDVWGSESFGTRGEAEAVAGQGWGSDAQFDAIDAQFDALDAPPSIGDTLSDAWGGITDTVGDTFGGWG